MELALDQTSAPAKRASREKIAQRVCRKVSESSFLMMGATKKAQANIYLSDVPFNQ